MIFNFDFFFLIISLILGSGGPNIIPTLSLRRSSATRMEFGKVPTLLTYSLKIVAPSQTDRINLDMPNQRGIYQAGLLK